MSLGYSILDECEGLVIRARRASALTHPPQGSGERDVFVDGLTPRYDSGRRDQTSRHRIESGADRRCLDVEASVCGFDRHLHQLSAAAHLLVEAEAALGRIDGNDAVGELDR